MIAPSQASRPSQPGASDLPPRRMQEVQTANSVAPPSVSSQQSPQIEARQRAHGPIAVPPQILQRATGASPPPAGISEPNDQPSLTSISVGSYAMSSRPTMHLSSKRNSSLRSPAVSAAKQETSPSSITASI